MTRALAHPHSPPLLRPASRALALAALAAPLAHCTLITDFSQCDSDADCATGRQCIEAICQGAPRRTVSPVVGQDLTLTADTTHVLEGVVTVLPSVTLTIEPGALSVGERGSALVLREGAQLQAVGTRQAPIVFTSAKPVGQRLAGRGVRDTTPRRP